MIEYEYSESEMRLIDFFGYKDIANSITPLHLYRMMLEYCFINNIKGDACESSLRRCYKAFNACEIYRMTPEWDVLIDL